MAKGTPETPPSTPPGTPPASPRKPAHPPGSPSRQGGVYQDTDSTATQAAKEKTHTGKVDQSRKDGSPISK